jgi:hypothetical protein
MQDPICAMKILRRPKFRVPNRNLVRPELRAAWRHECGDMAYPIDSQFASDAGGLFTTRAPTIGRNSAHERGCGGAMERARFNVRLLRLTTGPRQS